VNEIRLLIVPYELGRLREGVGRGPERLLELGAEDALSARGAAVHREVLELAEDFNLSGGSEIDASFELIRMVSARVRAAVKEGAFPVVLAGSCFAGVGIVAGLDERSPGVVWFDAHPDFNSPDTTVYGYLDAMGLAVLTGGAWQALHGTVEGATPLPETAVVLAGARDFDGPEERRLESSAVAHLTAESLRSPEPLLGAIAALTPSPTGLYVHVDLDVLDIDEARVNVYSAPDGVSAEQLETLVGAIAAGCPVRAFSLTAYDPECDVDDRVPPVALRLLSVVAEYVGANGPSSRR
jgi:arginase